MNDTAGGSKHSIMDATRSRAKFSGHGRALGASGYVSDTDDNFDFLGTTGQTTIFNPQKDGFADIRIGAAWQNLEVEQASGGFLGKFLKKKVLKKGVDLDLGCLYEMQDGTRGGLQAFGDSYGSYESAPFISLSKDDRTGDDDDDIDGLDEIMTLNGPHWPEVKRLLVYLYIYEGAQSWAEIKPQIHVEVPNEKPMVVTLHTYKSEMCLCAAAMLENVRGGIRMTNITEYYPSHPAMDRAFGFGLEWEDGTK